MTIKLTMRRVGAKPCDTCRGQGSTLGVFHRLPCPDCLAVGYVQSENGQPVDTIAASIIGEAREASAQAARLASLSAPNTGTPDNWILRNNFRGD